MVNWFLSNCVLALALAMVVLAIVRLSRPSPATVHALWCVVLLKLVSPLGLWWELPIPLPQNDVEESREIVSHVPTLPPLPEAEVAALPELVGPVPMEVSLALEWEVDLRLVDHSPPVDSPPIPELTRVETLERGSTPLEFAGLILSLGAGVYLLRQFLSTRRFSRLAFAAAPASESLVIEVRQVARDMGVKLPQIRVIRGLPGPVMLTLRKPVLLWPEGLENSLDRDGREAVLIHEIAHLRRRDHWIRWLEIVCGSLHWWNPLFWLARRQVRLNAELACDAWVMATKPGHRRTYAEALLKVCSRSMRGSRAAPVLGIGGDGTRDFTRRLKMIMQNDTPCRLTRRARAAILALALAFLPGLTLAQQTGKTEEKKAIEIEVHLQTTPKDAPKAEAVDPVKEKKVKDLEAKLAELQRQLDELKGGTSPEKKTQGIEARVKEAVKDILIQKVNPAVLPEKMVFPIDGMQLKGQILQGMPESGGRMKILLIGPDGKPKEDFLYLFDPTPKGSVPVPPAPPAVPATPAEVRQPKGVEKAIATRTITVTGTSNVISLTRGSYKITKQQADQLMEMFKDKSKGTVLEMKYEEEKLIVTTTPEVQGVISNVINLMTGKPVTAAPAAHGFGIGTFSLPATTAPMMPVGPISVPLPTPAPPAPVKSKEPEQLGAPRLLAEGR